MPTMPTVPTVPPPCPPQVRDERGVDELERYLPQLGHLILQLPADSLLTTVLELAQGVITP